MSRPAHRARPMAWLGIVTMVVASLVAPPQPELWQDGGACEVAPCGTLEDPPRLALAVAVWAVGAALAVVGTALRAHARRTGVLALVMGLLLLPVVLVCLAFMAVLVSLQTSALGGWTVLALGAGLPVVGVVAGQVRYWRERVDRRVADGEPSRSVVG